VENSQRFFLIADAIALALQRPQLDLRCCPHRLHIPLNLRAPSQATDMLLNTHPTTRFVDLKLSRRSQTFALAQENSRFYYTYNARGAIYQLLLSLPKSAKNTVLVPAFHCITVVEPIVRAGFEPRLYGINADLTTDEADLLEKLDERVAAVIVINYFGFSSAIDNVLDRWRSGGFFLIEDCAHSFIKNNPIQLSGGRGDASVYSFWKIVPSMVGSGLSINRQNLFFNPLKQRVPLKDSLVRTKRILEQAINNLDGGFIKTAFNYLEDRRVKWKRTAIDESMQTTGMNQENISGTYAFDAVLASAGIPWLSRFILHRADIETIVKTRRKNFNLILERLEESERLQKVFHGLPTDVCPLAFPVILHDRCHLDYQLRAQGVPLFTFGEVLHPHFYSDGADDRARMNALFLSQNLLCLPVHQNLSESDIDIFCATINHFLKTV